MKITKKLLLAAVVVSIFTVNNNFAVQNNDSKETQQNSEENQQNFDPKEEENSFCEENKVALTAAAILATGVAAYLVYKYTNLSDYICRAKTALKSTTDEVKSTKRINLKSISNNFGKIKEKIKEKISVIYNFCKKHTKHVSDFMSKKNEDGNEAPDNAYC